MADDTPIPVADVEDENPPEDLKRRPIPAYSEPVAPAPTARPIPVGSTEDLESRIPSRAPLGSTADLESRIGPHARPIPVSTAPSDEELYPSTRAENEQNPNSSAIQTGVASLWAKAHNIHNPILRVLGEIGAGGARALDTAGQAVGRVIPAVGAVESAIPGTTMNAEAKERTQAKQDAQQAELAGKEATTAHEQAQTGAIPAETGLKEAQTAALQNPKPDKPETPQQVLAGIVSEDLDKHVNPSDDPRVGQVSDTITSLQKETAGTKVPPLTADQASQRNAIWNPILTKNHLPMDVFKEGMSDADAKELAGQLNNATGKTQAGVKIDLGQDKGSKAENIKARQEVAKIYADPLASAERYNVMTASLDDALKNHDQQAMLNLLTNHIGMTMGLQKGARITQAILEEAQKSQPWLANIKAKFDGDGYLSGVTLGPEQMKSMVNLARGRFSQDVVKARSLAKYAGAEDDGPDRIPSTSTMHYYLGIAGNDVPKAKQMAAEDGWTVPEKK